MEPCKAGGTRPCAGLARLAETISNRCLYLKSTYSSRVPHLPHAQTAYQKPGLSMDEFARHDYHQHKHVTSNGFEYDLSSISRWFGPSRLGYDSSFRAHVVPPALTLRWTSKLLLSDFADSLLLAPSPQSAPLAPGDRSAGVGSGCGKCGAMEILVLDIRWC